MVDLARIEGFDWDEGNSLKSLDKHKVSQAEAEQVFLCKKLFVVADKKHSDLEPRLHALGQTYDGRLLHVSFTLRREGTLVRVISARDINRKERVIYEQEA